MKPVQFRAMGTDCHILIEADDRALEQELARLAVQRVDILEQCWSRFRPTSELSMLNARAGAGSIAVSEDLLLLVSRMAQAWELSDGLFDPTVLQSMNRLGYDADFATVVTRASGAATDISVIPAPGMSGVRLDASAATVSLPVGVGLDPGAIGKGLAADIVAEDLAAAGARAVLVNLGGDISIAGALDVPWVVGLDDERLPRDLEDRTLQILEFPAGTDRLGIATSTTMKRRWAQGRRHHVIDPRTGTMSSSDLVQVTVVDGAAWRAEVLATAALLQPSDLARTWLDELDIPAILLADDQLLSTMAMQTPDTLQEANHG